MEDTLDRINKLENKVNILSLDINNIKQDFTKMASNVDLLVKKLILDKENNKSEKKENNSEPKIKESFVDASGKLNNEKNPFIKEKLNIEEDESASNISKINKKRGKYKDRAHIHYYYRINGNVYKYTCKNKSAKNIIPFKYSDTLCPAKAVYNLLNDTFSIDENTEHIEYEKHHMQHTNFNVIKEKYDNNKFKESGFVDNTKLIGLYFKHMFMEDYKLTPIDAKYIFTKKYPNINLKVKDILTTINSKYRDAKNINQEKFKNTDDIFLLKDESNNIISRVIDYNENDEEQLKKNLLFWLILIC